MSVDRRQFNRRAIRILAAAAAGTGLPATLGATTPLRVLVAVPGPGNLLFLPITLAARLGFDRAQDIALDIRYVGGGPQAYQDLYDRNVDFAAGGLAALALQRLSGRMLSAIVPTTLVPAYTLLVRSDLRGKVRRVADLAGRVVGVKGHTPGGRSTSQLFTEYVMARAGVPMQRLNYVSVGQSYDSQHAGLASGAVDAIMGDEPFATRLVREKVAFVLEDFHDPGATRKLLGGLFINGAVSAREEYLARQPDIAARVVHCLRETLVWIDRSPAKELVEALRIEDRVERENLLEVLALRKKVYVPDGRFSDAQLATVERFFHATETSAAARAFRLSSAVDARWAGRSD